jgi:hypothetical protein
MCLRRAPEKYIAGAALDRAALKEFELRHFGWSARSQSLFRLRYNTFRNSSNNTYSYTKRTYLQYIYIYIYIYIYT